MRIALRHNDEVAHYWAHAVQEEGYSGPFSFRGPVLCSYGTPVAVRLTLPTGGAAAIFTELQHSVTTSTHRNLGVFAFPGLCLFAPGAVGRDTTPTAVFSAWETKIEVLAARYAEQTRKPSKAKAWRELQGAITAANAIASAFGLPPHPVPQDDAADAWVQATADRVRAKKAANEAAEAAEAKRRQRQDAAARRAARLLRAEWLAGATSVQPHSFSVLREVDGDCLRLSGDTIETSQRANVPVEDVRRFAPLLLRLVRAKEVWVCKGPVAERIKLGHYAVDMIDAKGTLRVGCHRFHAAEVERFAQVLGVAPEGSAS